MIVLFSCWSPKLCYMASYLKGLAAEKIPYYYGYMVKMITTTNIQYGYEGHNRMEERTSQWGGFPLFIVLGRDNSVDTQRNT